MNKKGLLMNNVFFSTCMFCLLCLCFDDFQSQWPIDVELCNESMTFITMLK
jgi:hypothetical protein